MAASQPWVTKGWWMELVNRGMRFRGQNPMYCIQSLDLILASLPDFILLFVYPPVYYCSGKILIDNTLYIIFVIWHSFSLSSNSLDEHVEVLPRTLNPNTRVERLGRVLVILELSEIHNFLGTIITSYLGMASCQVLSNFPTLNEVNHIHGLKPPEFRGAFWSGIIIALIIGRYR